VVSHPNLSYEGGAIGVLAGGDLFGSQEHRVRKAVGGEMKATG